MKTYHIIDKRGGDTRSELKHYTFDELKTYFEPSKDIKRDFPEEFEQWQKIQDLFDLEEFLKEQAAGMEQPYSFREDEVEDMAAMHRANHFFANAK